MLGQKRTKTLSDADVDFSFFIYIEIYIKGVNMTLLTSVELRELREKLKQEEFF